MSETDRDVVRGGDASGRCLCICRHCGDVSDEWTVAEVDVKGWMCEWEKMTLVGVGDVNKR